MQSLSLENTEKDSRCSSLQLAADTANGVIKQREKQIEDLQNQVCWLCNNTDLNSYDV